MAEKENWVVASPALDQVLLVYALAAVPLGTILLLAVGQDGPENIVRVIVRAFGLIMLLGLIPIYRRKRTGILRWNDEKVQQLGQSHFRHSSSMYLWKNLTEVEEPGVFGKWTTFQFGYGKSLSFRAKQDIPLSDYYKVLNVAKRKLKENARTS